MKDWFIDEMAHAGVEHLDSGFVAGYDRKQGHPSPAEDIEALTERGVGPDSTVLDMAAGTGQFTLAAATVFGTVIAVDVSPAMIAHIERRVAEANIENTTVVRGGFMSYEHSGPPLDAVFTRNALHQIPDFWKGLALEHMAGMLRPGGVLRVRDLVYDFDPAEAPAAFDNWFAGAVDDPTVGYTRQDFIDHIRTEHSTYRWLFEPLLEQSGFEIIDVSYRHHIYAAYTCVRAH